MKTIIKEIQKTIVLGKTKAVQTKNRWNIIGQDFISRKYLKVTKMGQYLLAYQESSKIHVYNEKGPICTKDNELLDYTGAEKVEKNVVILKKEDESQNIVIGEELFNVTDIQCIRTEENDYIGFCFQEVGGGVYLKMIGIEPKKVIAEECEKYSLEYKYVLGGETADVTINITAIDTKNQEHNQIIFVETLYKNGRYCRRICLQPIKEKVYNFLPEILEYVLIQIDETGKKGLYSVMSEYQIATEFSADGVDFIGKSERYAAFFKNTSNGKIYTEVYNLYKNERVFENILYKINGKKESLRFEEMNYTNINENVEKEGILICEKNIDGQIQSFLIIQDKGILLKEDKIEIKEFKKEENYAIIKENSGSIVIWLKEDDICMETINSEVVVKYCTDQNMIICDENGIEHVLS